MMPSFFNSMNEMDFYLLDALILFSLIAANGFFSMAEFAIISSRASRLHELRDAGHESADIALKLLENPGKFLSAIQVGITLVSILTGVFGGMAFSAPLGGVMTAVPLLAPYSTQLALGLVVVTITFITLVVGELAPKKIALQHPEKITLKIAGSIDLLCRLSAPAVTLINGSTNLLLRTLGVKSSEKPQVSDEEVMLMIRQGAKKGIFESVEYDMIARIFRLSDKQASAMMTPRSETDWLDLDKSDEELNSVILASGRSRFPVAEKNLDNLLGIVRSVDLVSFQLTGRGGLRDAIRASMKIPLFVPESVPAFHVLELFRKTASIWRWLLTNMAPFRAPSPLPMCLKALWGMCRPMTVKKTNTGLCVVACEHGLLMVFYPLTNFSEHSSWNPTTFRKKKMPLTRQWAAS